MQTVVTRAALAALLFTGIIGSHIGYGLNSAQAAGKDSPVTWVKTGLCESDQTFTIVIHGGVAWGGIHASKLPVMKQILSDARSALSSGARAIDVVEAVIAEMENSGLFNAGKAAMANQAGMMELDASIMTGWDLNAGAVAGVTNIKNQITAARAVMEKSEHVMLAGHGAEVFAEQEGLKIVDPSYFYTQKRFESFQKAKGMEKHGTVGCVALDKKGNLCAGTSTGGMTNKKYGRI